MNAAVLFSCRWFQVARKVVPLLVGGEQELVYIDFSRPAVGAVLCHGRRILLIQQYRPIVDRLVWAIPSGGVEDGESLEHAARRELIEESGYTPVGPSRHLIGFFASYGSSNQRYEIFRFDGFEPEVQAFDRNEVLDVKWFARRDIRSMVESGEIVDALSLPSLLMWCYSEE